MHGISYTLTNSWQTNSVTGKKSSFRSYLDFQKGNLNVQTLAFCDFSVSSTYSKEIASLAKCSLLTSLSILMPTPIPTNRTNIHLLHCLDS